MAASLKSPALNLREKLAQLDGMAHRFGLTVTERNTFWFSGDTSETDFPLDQGWEVENVFVDGALYRPGSGEDYTISYDGFRNTVVFAVAPAAVDIGIIATRAIK